MRSDQVRCSVRVPFQPRASTTRYSISVSFQPQESTQSKQSTRLQHEKEHQVCTYQEAYPITETSYLDWHQYRPRERLRLSPIPATRNHETKRACGTIRENVKPQWCMNHMFVLCDSIMQNCTNRRLNRSTPNLSQRTMR
jgi:hypothetical protein